MRRSSDGGRVEASERGSERTRERAPEEEEETQNKSLLSTFASGWKRHDVLMHVRHVCACVDLWAYTSGPVLPQTLRAHLLNQFLRN